MKIIVVSSAKSGLGKTEVIEWLLKKIDGMAVIKIAVESTRWGCSCLKGQPKLKTDFLIQEDRDISLKHNPDIERYIKCGVKKVVYVRAKPGHTEHALYRVLDKISTFKKVIIEGNHALYFLRPRVAVMILDKKKHIDPSARDNLDKVDVFLVPPDAKLQDLSLNMMQLEHKKLFFLEINNPGEKRKQFVDFVKKQLKGK